MFMQAEAWPVPVQVASSVRSLVVLWKPCGSAETLPGSLKTKPHSLQTQLYSRQMQLHPRQTWSPLEDTASSGECTTWSWAAIVWFCADPAHVSTQRELWLMETQLCPFAEHVSTQPTSSCGFLPRTDVA